MKTTKQSHNRTSLVMMITAMLLSLQLVSCVNDNHDEEPTATTETISVELSIQTSAISSITRASNTETYEDGSEWENYIDISSGDFRIYFFTYDPETETESGNGVNSTLIAEFTPTDIYPNDGTNHTTYTLLGKVGEDVSSNSDFKVVVLANWGANNYPSVTPGTTTIDDLCNAGTFNAFVNNGTATMPSSTLHIPFFGVHEYSGVTWSADETTNLDDAITLLRAVAKVEVILNTEDSNVDAFEDVSIVNYNAQGYCAPMGVYLKGDYDHSVHLVGGANDTDQSEHTITLDKTTNDDEQETWVCYLTEYRNINSSTGVANDDYSYIQLSANDLNYNIYFANYTDGETSSNADYDICRNNLYRFYVTYNVEAKIIEIRIDLTVTNQTDGYFNNVTNFDSY